MRRNMAKLLIIDDDTQICDTMTRVLTDDGHEVATSPTLLDGTELARSGAYDVVFLDVKLPDGDGLREIRKIQSVPSAPEVIIITGYADADGAESAIKNNAWDYLKKPVTLEAMSLTLARALRYRAEKQSARPPVELIRNDIIGGSPKIKRCLELVAKAADSRTNILITGETGTGKELFARAIHENSDRSRRNFVVVDCGSLPETLIESLLFGHTKGAFTGADRAETGFIKHADGGTLFLDEVGELSISSQRSLLRVLQERRFHPVGAATEVESDFRLVAATNQDLDAMVRRETFRKDLLFRLRSITIELPPLRERLEDIRPLVDHYVKRLCDSHKVEMKGFSPDFYDELHAYGWSGNVRELFSALEWAMAHGLYEPTLYPKHLPPQIRIQVARSHFPGEGSETPPEEPNGAAGTAPVDPEHPLAEGDTPAEFHPPPRANPDGPRLTRWKEYRRNLLEAGEKRYLDALMERTGGDVKEASRLSGLSKPRIYELLRKYRTP